MEYDADLTPYNPCWEIKIPSFYDPLHHMTRRDGEIGNRRNPNNLIVLTTHSSEEARRQYLHFVSLMEDERYNSAHLQAYAHSWPNP